MMHNKLQHAFLAIISITGLLPIYAQSPAIEWQQTIGGTAEDKIYAGEQTADGGYILGGYSRSGISGDKTEAFVGSDDYWIVKTDANGNIEWQNTIGGTASDKLVEIHQTSDGGYIVGGTSQSGISGDKTEVKKGPSDYWVLKLDAFGNIIWQNTLGGNSNEYFTCILETSDGNYIVGGYSSSDISGDKTENTNGGYDFWILKLNSSGNIVWQNTIGGNFTDYLWDIFQTPEGAYIAAGDSYSDISGDKSEGTSGGNDVWVMKLNASGNIVWQNTIAGESTDDLADMQQDLNGDIILAITSNSDIGADKTEEGLGLNDFWLVKLNGAGNIIAQNTIGGSSTDIPGGLAVMPDGGYLFGGTSHSLISGDKTETNVGLSDYWIFKTDGAFNILWQETIGTSVNEEFADINPTADGGYFLSGSSNANISGDKTENAVGNFDYWIIKSEGIECVPATEICNLLDDDCNGLIDDDVIVTISITAEGATTFCQGGNVTLSSSYTGMNVQWKKNGSNIPGATSTEYIATKSGNYTCFTYGDCGSALSNTIAVSVNPNPSASISAGGTTTFCAGGSVTLNVALVADCTYQWYKGAMALAGETNTSYIATTAGNYKCRVTKTATGCYKNSNAIAVTVPCRDGEITENLSQQAGPITNNSFTIFPNPNNGTFTISGSLHETNIQIYNAVGQLVYAKQMGEVKVDETIELKDISSGVYILETKNGDTYSNQQFIIQSK